MGQREFVDSLKELKAELKEGHAFGSGQFTVEHGIKLVNALLVESGEEVEVVYVPSLTAAEKVAAVAQDAKADEDTNEAEAEKVAE